MLCRLSLLAVGMIQSVQHSGFLKISLYPIGLRQFQFENRSNVVWYEPYGGWLSVVVEVSSSFEEKRPRPCDITASHPCPLAALTVTIARAVCNMNGNKDPLRWPSSAGRASNSDSSPGVAHMKTYTAGEDKSRLQQVAKELGLAEARKPRRQVRKQSSNHHLSLPHMVHVLLAPSTEDARMRAVYSSHQRMTEEDRQIFHYQSLPGWAMDTLIEEEEGLPGVIDDGHGPIGGDLVSAVLGIIKAMVSRACVIVGTKLPAYSTILFAFLF